MKEKSVGQANRGERQKKPGSRPRRTPDLSEAGGDAPIGTAIYESIKHDIITLALKPGQKVSEQILVARYKVGKAPVRVALVRLVQEGMIESRARAGHFVSPVTLRGMRDLYAMRRLLLPEAASLAAGSITPEIKAAAERAIKIEFSPDDPESVLAFCFANRDFITAIGHASGNQLLAQWLETMEDRALRVLFLSSLTLPRVEIFRRQYEEVWSALKAGDGQVARKAVEAALTESEVAAMEAILALPHLQSVNLAG